MRDLRELEAVLRGASVFESPEVIGSALRSLQSYSRSEAVGVGIKTVLTVAELAKITGGHVGDVFAERLISKIQS